MLGGDEEVLVGSVAGGGRWADLTFNTIHPSVWFCFEMYFLFNTALLKPLNPGTMALLGCSILRVGVSPALE